MNKQMLRLIAIFMSFILFIHAFPSFPLPVLAENVAEDATETEEAVPVMEVLEKRSEYAKHYLMSDGTHKMVTYPTPVHYQKDSEWAEIDQTLIAEGNRLIPRSSPLEVSFGTTVGDPLFSLKDRETDQELSFDLLNKQVAPPQETLTATATLNEDPLDPYAVADRLTNKLTFQNVLSGTDLEYELTANRIKESIIIESASSTQSYTFLISGAAYRLVLEPDKSVRIYRKADDTLAYVIEAPYMFDAAGAESTDIEVTVEEVKGNWLMNIAPSSAWLNHESRSFPITLDPTVQIPNLSEHIKAASHKGSTVTHLSATSGVLDSGLARSGSQLTGTYIKFTLPPLDYDCLPNTSDTNDQAFFGGTVVDAQLHFLANNVGTVPAKLPIMEVFRNTSAWINNFSNSNRPARAELPEAAAFVTQTNTADSTYRYTADITAMVREWYKDPSTNNGLYMIPSLQQANASNFDFDIGFHAKSGGETVMQTVIEVTYISNIGLENYWTYTSEAVGNGAVHVNHSSGLATAVVTDTVSNNQRNGATVTHVYHDALSIYAAPAAIGEVGKGFMLNVQELLWEQYDENGESYYRHRDADGTYHYYLPTATANRYAKETDPTSYLIVPTSSQQPIKLYYKDKSFKEFRFDCLTACQDANGNRIEITLNTTMETDFYYPIAVKEILASGVTRNTTLAWEYYNNVPYLSSITSPEGEIATFTYDDTQLTKITWNIGQSVPMGSNTSSGTQAFMNFTYDASGLLRSLTDGWTQDNLTITRSGNQVSRLKKVMQAKANTTTIARPLSDYTFSYGDLTSVTNDGYTMTYRFDHCGRTVGVSDSEGNSKYFEFGAAGGAQNKITLESKLIQRSSNMIIDPCFEQEGEGAGYAWSFNNGAYVTGDSNEGYYSGALTIGGQISQAVAIDQSGYYCLSADISLEDNAEILLKIIAADGTVVETSETSPLVAELEKDATYTLVFEFPETATYGSGRCIIDRVNFHAGETPLTLNRIVNGEIVGRLNQDGDPDGWVNISAGSDVVSYADSMITIQGNPEQKNRVKQTVALSGSAGEELIFSATVSNNGLPNLDTGDGTRTAAAMTLAMHHTDGTYSYSTVFIQPDINATVHDVSGSINAWKDFDSVELYLKFDYNMNRVTFDNLWLAKESFGTRYTVDTNGNVTSVKNRNGNQSAMTYNSMGQPLNQTDALGNVTKNTYGKGNTNSLSSNNNQLLKTEAPMGQTTEYTYDIYGNVTSTKVGGSGFTSTTAITQYLYGGETVYGNYGTTVSSVTDAFGNTTSYTYDPQSLKTQNITAPNGTVNGHHYADHSTDGPLYWQYTQSGNNYLASVWYGYKNGQLTDIDRKGFAYRLSEPLYSTESGAMYQTTTTIDVYNNETADRVLAAQHYDNHGQLIKQVYGNYNDGSTPTNELYAGSHLYRMRYDTAGRVRETLRGEYSGNVGVKEKYYYDREGNLSRIIENNRLSGADLISNFFYDLAGRLTQKTLSGRVNATMTYEYDALNRVSKSVVNGVTSEYVYNANSQLTRQTFSGLPTAQHSYDALGRYQYTAWGSGQYNIFRSVSYANGTRSGKPQQTERIGQVAMRYAQMDTSLPADDRILYTYDSMGNITKETVYRGSTLVYTVDYTYDGLNQLLSATTKNSSGAVLHSESYTYVQDDTYGYSGNIATAVKDGNTYAYTYSNEWTDLLQSVTKNGTSVRSFQYDAIGNPISDGTYTYDWIYGRTLYRIRQGTTDLARYFYDANGVRIRKVTGGTTTEYLTDGSTILQETKSGTVNATLKYVYGQSGLEYILHNGNVYWPLRNQQGDILGLAQINSNGSATLVCRYEYSAFGELLSVTDANGNPITAANHIANLNPFRYRGYYYDTETGYYYLQSRYYDPEIGRFLNADSFVSTGQDATGFNMFAYCGNNPINRIDPTGQFWGEIVGFFEDVGRQIAKVLRSFAPAYATAGGLAAADGPLPFGDAVGAVATVGLTLGVMVMGVFRAFSSSSLKVKEKNKTPPSSTIIYRYGGTNPGNFVPSFRDVKTNSGLSFSTSPPPPGIPASVTTIEALNATGVVRAYQDKPGHVRVDPVFGTLADWRNGRSKHPCTIAVRSVVVKWNGEN